MIRANMCKTVDARADTCYNKNMKGGHNENIGTCENIKKE